MINAKESRESKVIADVCDRVLIAVGPHCLRVDGLEGPVLSGGEHRIGRSTATHALHKQMWIAPRIEAFLMQPQGHIKVQTGSGGIAVPGKLAELRLDLPLRVKVVLLCLLVLSSVLLGPKPSIFTRFSVFDQKRMKFYFSRHISRFEKLIRECFQDSPLCLLGCRIID